MISQKQHISTDKKQKDMTQGNIAKHLISFAVPLLLGNIFQQFYNTVDTWVIGNFTTNEAYSAVGSVGPIINMLIGIFMGLSSGAGVVVSQSFGAKQYDKVHKAVHTCVAMTLILIVLFTALGILMTPAMLKFMKMPSDVSPYAKTYLTIYFAGIAGLMLYNMGAGILRAIGDSRRPFYFLVVSAVLNTVLDLLFVIKFNMGVAGVAYATIISQGISAILVLITLLRTSTCVKLRIKEIRLWKEQILLILKVGIPASVQLAITAFSNVFVQSYINQFGPDCMSGWTTYAKLDQFMFLPMQSIGLSATTFVGQNLGMGNVERAKKGVRIASLMSLLCTAVIMLPLIIFAPYAGAIFNDKPEVLTYSTALMRWISPFYLLCCFNQIYSAALRGAGNSRIPMIIMICSFVLFRQGYLFIMSNFICNEIIPLAMGYPAGWAVCSLATLIYYKKTDLLRTKLVS